ncbi:MAG: hypothetical protein GXY17_09325 [Clostridiaceae bacterium]|jgi:hypothetical protein|nr:hypothetical protein [Clostridiaceae bacterium]
MLGKLIGYEFIKKWRTSKFVLLGYAMIQAALLLIMRVFLWNEHVAKGFQVKLDGVIINEGSASGDVGAAFAVLSGIFFLLALFIGAYPFLESIYRFERDLSGKQAYLELMLPVAAWKKVLAKLITTLGSLIVCGTLSLMSMFVYFMVNSNFKYFLEIVKAFMEALLRDGLSIVLLVLNMLFAFAFFYLVIFLCITIAKSFTHKNAIAVPIGILAFVLAITGMAALEAQVDKVPIYTYSILGSEFTVSSILLELALFVLALMGTSQLMEKRIEH